MKSAKIIDPKPVDLAAVSKLISRPQSEPKGTGGSAEGAQELARTKEERWPSPIELATLAALLTINDGIRHPDEKKETKDFLSAAYELVRDAEDSLPFNLAAEAINKIGKTHKSPYDALSREYSWDEVLTVQKAVPAAVETEASTSSSSLNRFVDGAPVPKHLVWPYEGFEPSLFSHDDLANRPVGISMVGSIGTEKALRNAIKRVFPQKDVTAIVVRKTLTLWEINQILRDQLKIHKGRIPKVKAKSKVP